MADFGNALTTQLGADVNTSAPQSVEELQQRKAGWGNFLQQMQTDPKMRMALLQFGVNLAQPYPQGQTAAGHLARSVGSSIDYLAAQREAERTAGLEERKQKLAEQTGAANIEHTQAQTAGTQAATASTQQKTEQSGQMFPLQVQAAEKKLVEADYTLKQLKAQEAAGLFTPGWEQRVAQAKLDKDLAAIELSKAHAGAYRAVAAKESPTKQGKTLLNAHTTAEGIRTETYQIGNEIYHTVFQPPELMDLGQAQQMAQREAEKKAGWFGRVDAAGVAQRVKELTSPRMATYDANGRLMPGGLPTIPSGVPAAPAAKSPSPAGFPDGQGAAGDREFILRQEYDKTKQMIAASNAPAEKAKLQGELKALEKEAQTAGVKLAVEAQPTASTAAPKVINVVRGADGNLSIEGNKAPSTVATAPSNAEVNVMIRAAKNGDQNAKAKVREYLDGNMLSLAQRTAASKALE